MAVGRRRPRLAIGSVTGDRQSEGNSQNGPDRARRITADPLEVAEMLERAGMAANDGGRSATSDTAELRFDPCLTVPDPDS
jgi:hypothetical protein